MQKVVIVLKGGLVYDVLTEEPAEIMIADLDTEGIAPEDVTEIPGVGNSYVTIEPSVVSKEDVSKIFAAFAE